MQVSGTSFFYKFLDRVSPLLDKLYINSVMCAVRKPDADAVCKYVAGYNECASQVAQYLTSLPTNCGDRSSGNRDKLVEDTRCSLLDHLANSLHQSAAAAVSSKHNQSQTTLQTTADQSASSSLAPSAVYVISPQQVPVTSSSPTNQLRVLPARLNSAGQFVLLLAGSAADHQHGGCLTENSKLAKLDSCDVIALEAGDTVSGCTGECEILRDCDVERQCVNSQSESPPAALDDQEDTDDLHMWRPW